MLLWLEALAAAVLLCTQTSFALYSPSGPVKLLDESNFEGSLRRGAWIVEFFAPWCGHCKNLAPEWEKAAQALQGIINVAAVDADAHKSLSGQYGVQGFPTIKFMYNDGSKIKSVDYKGGRTAGDIINFAMDKAKSLALKRIGQKPKPGGSGSGGSGTGEGSGFYSASSGVANLSAGSFDQEVLQSGDMWYVEFYAPWCGHCKALKPEYESAARELHGKVKVGAVNCDVEKSLCSSHGIQGFPTIKFFGNNKQRPQDYSGSRDARGLVDFALKAWAKAAPAPEVLEVTAPSIFDSNCGSGSPQSQLCFIAFLPDILDSKASGRKAYINVLKTVAEEYKDRPFRYLWAAAGMQAALEAKFGVGGFGYPALVAFNPQRAAFVPMREALEKAHLKDFVQSIRMGARSGVPVQNVGGQIISTTPWDGQDGKIDVQDEFSLDDIMGHDL